MPPPPAEPRAPLLFIEVRFTADFQPEPDGVDVMHVVREAVALANHLGVGVTFEYEGERIYAKPGDDPTGF